MRATRAVRLVLRARPPCTTQSCLRAMFTLAFVLTNTHHPRLLSSLSSTDTHTPVKHTRLQVLSDDDEWSRCDALRRIIHGRRRQRVVEAHSRVRSAAVHSFSFYLFPVLATPRPSSSLFLLVLFIPFVDLISVEGSLVCTFSSSLFSDSCVRLLDLVVVAVRGPLFAIPISKRVVDAHPRVRCGDLFIHSITMPSIFSITPSCHSLGG
jgi:hypothetical protein